MEQDAPKVHEFLRFLDGGCPVRVRKPDSPRLRAVQPSGEGRGLTRRFVIKSIELRRIFALTLCSYTQAFPGIHKGFWQFDKWRS